MACHSHPENRLDAVLTPRWNGRMIRRKSRTGHVLKRVASPGRIIQRISVFFTAIHDFRGFTLGIRQSPFMGEQMRQ
jgi:hypothetical protein